MTKLTSRFDGKPHEYIFGWCKAQQRSDKSWYLETRRGWTVTTTNLQRAVRMFRVGALFPHQYSTAPIPRDETEWPGNTPA